jgi:diguanylate cyclase
MNDDRISSTSMDPEAESLKPQLLAVKRALLRVSMAADGLNDRLDGQLAALREAVRDEIQLDELNRLVENISSCLLELDQQRRAQPRPRIPRLAPWLDAMARQADPEIRAPLQALSDRLEPDGSADLQVWEQALRLLPLAMQRPTTRAWWQPWQRPQRAAAQALVAPAPVRSTLARLIDQLRLPESLAAQAKALRTKLERELPLVELPSVVDDITGLILDADREESHELGSFLKQVTDRLADLQSFLAARETEQRQADMDNDALDAAIRTQVHDLHTSLQSAADLGSLKRTLSRQLDGIVERVTDFVQRQRLQQIEQKRQIEELRKMLEDGEREAERLRTNLIQQQRKAQLDPLTQAINREAYQQRLDYEQARWRRYGTPLSLIIGDIDNFKQINDRFGHTTGDKVLCAVAQILQANCRQTDTLARYGGEEFVVLMPETRLEQAARAAEKLRAAVAGQAFRADGKPILITVSFGIAEFQAGDTAESVFQRADRALYQAKHAGRNRVELERPPATKKGA